MRTPLVDKIARRAERARRKAERKTSYGKRSAHVRVSNLTRRFEYIMGVHGVDEATAYNSGRP